MPDTGSGKCTARGPEGGCRPGFPPSQELPPGSPDMHTAHTDQRLRPPEDRENVTAIQQRSKCQESTQKTLTWKEGHGGEAGSLALCPSVGGRTTSSGRGAETCGGSCPRGQWAVSASPGRPWSLCRFLPAPRRLRAGSVLPILTVVLGSRACVSCRLKSGRSLKRVLLRQGLSTGN